jgi:hypothetical protein
MHKYRMDFILLDCEAAVAVGEGMSNYPACTHCTLKTNLIIMKRQLVKVSPIILHALIAHQTPIFSS